MATESLKTFQPAAEPSFTEFTLDASREEELLKELSFTNGECLCKQQTVPPSTLSNQYVLTRISELMVWPLLHCRLETLIHFVAHRKL